MKLQGCVMPNALQRARHYRNRAAECQALADAVKSAELKGQYHAIAVTYIALAQAEEAIIQSRAIISESRSELLADAVASATNSGEPTR